MSFIKFHKKTSKEKPAIPEKFKFRMDVPHGYREIAQSYCVRNLGKSYMYYWPQAKCWQTNNEATWVYDTSTGAIFFTTEDNTSIISIILLSYPPEKKFKSG